MELLQHINFDKSLLNLTGVYSISHTLKPAKLYIGSASCTNSVITGFKRRMCRHLSELKNNKHLNIKLQRLVNKYGVEGLQFDIVEICSPEDCTEREEYWINFYNSVKQGFNILPGATLSSLLGRKLTEEQKEKIRQSNIGKFVSKETGRRISESKKGTIISKEHRIKLSNNCPHKKKVFCYNENGLYKVFDSGVEASRFFNFKKKSAIEGYVSRESLVRRKYIVSYTELDATKIALRFMKKKESDKLKNEKMNQGRLLRKYRANCEVNISQQCNA